MANTLIEYKEIRFIVDEDLTHCYVLINNLSNDGMLGVQGWHYKAFSEKYSTMDILKKWADGLEEPLLWPQKAPK